MRLHEFARSGRLALPAALTAALAATLAVTLSGPVHAL